MLHKLLPTNIQQIIFFLNQENDTSYYELKNNTRLFAAYNIMCFHLRLIKLLDNFQEIETIFIQRPLLNIKKDISFNFIEYNSKSESAINKELHEIRKLFAGKANNQAMIAQYFEGLPVFYKNKQPYCLNRHNKSDYLKSVFGKALFNAYQLNKEKKILKNTVKAYTLYNNSNFQQRRL